MTHEPLSGVHFRDVYIPPIDIDRLDSDFDIVRSPAEVEEREEKVASIMLPEVTEIEGLPMHLTIEEFDTVLDAVLPTWIEFRRHSLLPRQNVKGAAKLAMYADLLSAKAVYASSEPLLASVQSASETAKVYASLEKGSVSAAAARAHHRVDGTLSYIEPNKLPFRVLDVYNGPVLSARIEERPGYISHADLGSSEPLQPADGLACDCKFWAKIHFFLIFHNFSLLTFYALLMYLSRCCNRLLSVSVSVSVSPFSLPPCLPPSLALALSRWHASRCQGRDL